MRKPAYRKRKPAYWLGALALLVGAAPGVVAQDLGQLCQAVGKLTVGQWATYAVTGGPMNGSSLRFAIIGSEQHNDSTFYWFEFVRSSGGPQPDGIVQALIPGWGVPGNPRGVVVKMGSEPAMRMPDRMMALGHTANPGADMAHHCATAQTVGWESVTVPAGTIRALHIKDADGNEAWIASTVPFGLVLAKKPDGGQLALSGRGSDAKSSLHEVPQDLPVAPGAPK